MRVYIKPSAADVTEWAAQYIAQQINSFKPSAERTHFVIGLPTGSTPIPVFKRLVEMHRAGTLSFKNVASFNMDEYVAMVFVPDGMVGDLAAECAAYESKMKALGGVDLFIAGLGPDGHIAFNEPGTSLTSRTRVKTLAAHTVALADSEGVATPHMAISVGIQTILDAKEVLMLVTGASKAAALQHVVEEGVNHFWPASSLQNHVNAIVVCDADATLDMRVRTVNYFQGLHEMNKTAAASERAGVGRRHSGHWVADV